MTWQLTKAQHRRGAMLALFCAAMVLFVHTLAWAAADAAGGPDGRLAGYIAGLTIAALVGYSIFLCLKPLLDRSDSGLLQPLLILIAIWVLKQSVLPLFPGFGVDVGSYQAWAHRMSEVGPAGMYKPGYFLDYPPGYLYALWLVGAIGNLTGMGGEAFRQMTESPSLVADFLLALVVFAYLRRKTKSALAYGGMLMVALNPAMLFESVV